MATSRVRLWTYDSGASGWDRVDLAPCQAAVHDSNPTIEEQTRLGRTVIVTPSDASEAACWADKLELVFHRRKSFSSNVKPAGGTDRNFSEWARHYFRDAQADPDAELYVYIDTYGRDDAGAAVHTIRYYKGSVGRPLPPALIDAQFTIDRGDEYLHLMLIVSQTQGEGTVADFDDEPDAGGNLTPRTVS